MALDKETLTGILEGVEGADVRIDKILKEYDSDVTGLKVKNNELLSKNKDFSGSIEKLNTDFGTKEADFKKQIEGLNAQIKASGGEELKAVYEGEVKKLQELHNAKLVDLEKLAAQQKTAYDVLFSEYLQTLENTEYDQAISKIENLKQGAAPSIRSILRDRNKFELVDLEGVKELRNPKNNHKTIADTVTAFFATDEGKSFLLNNNSGGGASGSTTTHTSTKNPWKKETLNITEQILLTKENPTLAAQLKAQAGV